MKHGSFQFNQFCFYFSQSDLSAALDEALTNLPAAESTVDYEGDAARIDDFVSLEDWNEFLFYQISVVLIQTILILKKDS